MFAPELNAKIILSLLFLSFIISTPSVNAESSPQIFLQFGHNFPVSSVSFSPDGNEIASGSHDNTVMIWDVQSGILLRTLGGHTKPVSSVGFSPDGNQIVSGSHDNTVRIWDAKSGILLRTLSGHTKPVSSVSFSPDGKQIVSGSHDNTVRIWDAKSGILLRTLSGHTKPVNSVDFSPDGKQIVSGSHDNTVRIWDAKSGTLLHTLSEHTGWVSSVSFSPDGNQIVSGSHNNTVKIWYAYSGTLLRTLSGHTKPVSSVSFSPDGKQIVSGSHDNTVRIWGAQSGTLLRTLSGHTGWVSSVSFSPDGNQTLSGSHDNTVRIWDAKSGTLLRTLSGHTKPVSSVDFSPDGKQVVSGSIDNTIKIWHAQSGTLLHTLSGHTKPVRSVSFSPDGKQIASGSDDNSVKIWDAVDGSLLINMVLLPDNEWITYRPGKLSYFSSLKGDEYATVRFNTETYPVYPLHYYREELKKPKWFQYLSETQPPIKPKRFRLWWDEFQSQILWIGGIIFIIATVFAFTFILRKRSDPLKVSKQFFARAGFKNIEDLPEKILRLQAGDDKTAAIVSLWDEGKSKLALSGAIKKYTKASDKKTKLYLVYSAQRPSTETIQSLREERLEVIPILSNKLERALIIQTDEGILKILRELEDPFLARIDPYAESKPIHDPTWFYGRHDLMERLPKMLSQGQHVGIFGLRKVGKTSLIKQIQERFIGTPTAYIDCQAFSTKSVDYFKEILNQLHDELNKRKFRKLPPAKSVKWITSEEDFRTAFLSLFNVWKNADGHKPFIIILDEIDKFFPSREQKNSENILSEYVNFYRVLRGIDQSKPCLATLVVAYRPDINRHDSLLPTVGENPMFKSFHEVFLGFLSSSDSVQMIQGIGLYKDIIWEKKAAHRVFYYCGGHPLVSRYFASMACEQGSRKKIDFLQVEHTAKTIQKTLYKNEIGNYYSEVWEKLSVKEKDLLSIICRKEDQNLTVEQIPSKFDEALTNLENYNIVANDDGTLKITVQLFQTWAIRKLRR